MAVQIRLTGPEDEVRAAHAQLRASLAPGSQHITGVQPHRKGAAWYGDVDTVSARCPRGCREGECYCGEMTYAEANGVCSGCGGHDGDCYCGEE